MKERMNAKHNNTQKHRCRFLASLLAFILMIGCVMIPNTQAEASSLSLGVSASSVKIGDTVTLSITVPAGVSATVNVTYPTSVFEFKSASDTASANGGTVSMTIGDYGSSNTKKTGTMKFKAKASGSATFSASAPIAGNQEGDRVSIGGASASVTVKNEANNGGSGNGGSNNGGGSSNGGGSNNGGSNNGGSNNGDDSKKSGDNSLASLTLSAGKLSPSFKYNITKYTAEVDHDVTSVVVSAKPSNAKAEVESVTGGEKLSVGANKIQVVVKAENGVKATYTITVTRKAAGDAGEEPDNPQDNNRQEPNQQEPDTPEEPDDVTEPEEKCFETNGVKLYPSKDGDKSLIPDGFTESEITLWDTAYPYWINDKIGDDIGLIYLVDENQENGAWYRISGSSPQEVNSFVCLRSEFGYIIAVPEKLSGSAPQGYTPQTISIEGKGTVDVYGKTDDDNLCLIYAVNQNGEYALYYYDAQDRTYMRYNETLTMGDAQLEEPSTETETTGIEELKSQTRLLFYAFVVVVAILLLVIIVLTIKKAHSSHYEDDDEDDDEDDEEDIDEDDEEHEDESGEIKESQQSEVGAGIAKRYDPSVFKGDPAKEDAPVDESDDAFASESDNAPVDESEAKECVGAESEDPAPVNAKQNTDEDEAYSEAEDGAVLEEEPKKKKKRRGLFGRRRKGLDDEDDDIEFLDL